MAEQVQDLYGNRVRVRACGICIKDGAMLMVNHKFLHHHEFWAPPGGGVQFGETAENCLIREVKEETGLEVAVGGFLFVVEFIKKPLHAIELFFFMTQTGGRLRMGADPEMKSDQQIIQEVRFMPLEEIKRLPQGNLHGIFQFVPESSQITDLRGHFKL